MHSQFSLKTRWKAVVQSIRQIWNTRIETLHRINFCRKLQLLESTPIRGLNSAQISSNFSGPPWNFEPPA